MMERLNPRSRSDSYGSRINRDHSLILMIVVPWATVLLASLVPLFPISASIALMPPLALLVLLTWRLARPGLMPVWCGFPLGLWNDLFSGQPFGFSIVTFSLALLAIDLVETRFPWRGFLQDWITAGAIVTVYLVVGMVFSGGEISAIKLGALVPQWIGSIVVFPVIGRLVGAFDWLRLLRVRIA